MTPAREYAWTLTGIVAASASAVICVNRVWQTSVTTALPGADGTAVEVAASGAELVTGSAAAAWAAMLCALAVLATRRLGRVLAGLVLVVSGGYLAVQGGLFPRGVAVGAEATLWWLPTAAAGAVILVCGALAIARGGVWPALGRRYERGPSRAHEESAWDALDAGRDPTLPDD